MKRALLIGIFCFVACSSLASAASRDTMHARLVPTAPAHAGGGTFLGTVDVGAKSATVRWRLSLSGIGSSPARATFTFARSKVSLPLCAACKGSSQGTLVMLSRDWHDIATHGARIVVSNRAHPGGILRGSVVTG